MLRKSEVDKRQVTAVEDVFEDLLFKRIRIFKRSIL